MPLPPGFGVRRSRQRDLAALFDLMGLDVS
jgi:hypothetical protein